MTVSLKPASLNASLLLARKGEAMPAVAATSQNNPGLAWGAPVHPEDVTALPQPHPTHAHNPQSKVVATARMRPEQLPHPEPRPEQRPEHRPRSDARLSPDSFFSGRNRNEPRKVPVAHNSDLVALTMRIEDEAYLRLKYLAQQSGRSAMHVLNDALDTHLSRSGVPKSRKLIVKPG